jgi:hypothetical protein
MATIADEIDELLGSPRIEQLGSQQRNSEEKLGVGRGLSASKLQDVSESQPIERVIPTPTRLADLAAFASPPKNEKALIEIAKQRIWLHWLMWFFPILSIVTCFLSAVLIRNVKPIAIAMGVAFAFGIIGGASGD